MISTARYKHGAVLDLSYSYTSSEHVYSRGDECPPWFTLDYTNDSLFPQCVCSQAASEFLHYLQSERERTSYIKLLHF